jgi:hypothetical protein
MEKEKKKEQNKPILMEKSVKNEKSQSILITRVNKFEEEPHTNLSKIIETPLKKAEPIKINNPITKNKVTDMPTSTPKIEEKNSKNRGTTKSRNKNIQIKKKRKTIL